MLYTVHPRQQITARLFKLPRSRSDSALAFGGFELDCATGRLTRDQEPIDLAPHCTRLLLYLIRHRDRPVSCRELIHSLWERRVIEENVALNFAVSGLREALDDGASRPRFIATVPRFGYRFVGKLEPGSGSFLPDWFRRRH